ncbi:MAG TPA: MFS transporter [Candidatus Limnocylindrales bacterium]
MTSLRIMVLSVGVAVGVFLPFVAVILAELGFSPSAIGLVFALGAIAFTVAVPAWGHLADVRLGRPRTLQVGAVGAAIVLLVLLGSWPRPVVAILFVAFWVFESSWQPLSDAMTVNALPGRGRGYARVRLLTSFSFAVGTVAAGLVFDRTGYRPAFVIAAVCALAMAIASAGIPDIARADLSALRSTLSAEGPARGGPAGHRTWHFGSAGVALRVAPRLGLVLTAVALVHVGVISGNTFLGLRLVELGGGPSAVALSAGLSAVAEIPAMLVVGWAASRIGLRGLFAGSASIYAVCLASWAIADAPGLIIASRLLTGLAFAGLVVSVVLTIATLLPSDLQATGQTLFQMTAFGVAAIAANVVGGFLYGSVSPAAAFSLGALMAVVGAVVGWFVLPGVTQRA